MSKVQATLGLLERNGLHAEIVTGAGTGTYLLEAAAGVYNEIQPGSYIFMDADYGRNLSDDGKPVREFQQSLFILATVMSHLDAARAAVDAGLKAHSVDSGHAIGDRYRGRRLHQGLGRAWRDRACRTRQRQARPENAPGTGSLRSRL